jgi:NifU-like protein involved in Fe-S cluster formation
VANWRYDAGLPELDMLNEIYNAKILELAGNIPLCERLTDADGSAVKHSRLCGSKVSVDVKLDGDVVVAYGQDVKACALGQAACSIMARHIVGANKKDLRSLRDQVFAMLKEDGKPPNGEWADIAALQPVKDFKARHPSTMLVFDAVCEAIEQ